MQSSPRSPQQPAQRRTHGGVQRQVGESQIFAARAQGGENDSVGGQGSGRPFHGTGARSGQQRRAQPGVGRLACGRQPASEGDQVHRVWQTAQHARKKSRRLTAQAVMLRARGQRHVPRPTLVKIFGVDAGAFFGKIFAPGDALAVVPVVFVPVLFSDEGRGRALLRQQPLRHGRSGPFSRLRRGFRQCGRIVAVGRALRVLYAFFGQNHAGGGVVKTFRHMFAQILAKGRLRGLEPQHGVRRAHKIAAYSWQQHQSLSIRL